MMSQQLIQQCNQVLKEYLEREYGLGNFSTEDCWETETQMHYKVKVKDVSGLIHFVVGADLNPMVEGNQ